MFLTRITILILSVLLFTPAALAQKRSSRKKSPHTPQTRVQTLPAPQPTPPQKSEDEIIIEEERQRLSTLSADDKAAVREAIERLYRTLRRVQVSGYDKYFLQQEETQQTETLVINAVKLLPPSILKKLLDYTWRAILDSHIADYYYREGLLKVPSGADKFIGIIDHYKLKGMPSVLIGDKVLELSDEALQYVMMLAQQADIISTSER